MTAQAQTQDGKKTEQTHVEIVRKGEQIIVPPTISLKDARTWLERQEKAEEQPFAVHETINAFPLEGALAFAKAVSRKYGFSQMVPTPGWFTRPPYMIGVPIDIDKTEMVPWGRIEIPNIEGYLETGFSFEDGRFLFTIEGTIKHKNKHDVEALVTLTREIAKDESIYKGKAIRISFPKDDEDLNPGKGPTFISVKNVVEEELIFSKETDQRVRKNIFTPVEKTDFCRKEEVPLKRGILLAGPFGVGKTLTAYVMAKKCIENGWTFLYLSDVRDLKSAIHFARSYAPAVIFAEDIDSMMAKDKNRSEEVDEILNTIDGVDTKGQEVMIIVTTNHAEAIEPALMRPGRIDVIVPIEAPDTEAVLRLVKLYARGTLAPNQNFAELGKKLAGRIPAVIREVVERSKLAAITRLPNGATLSITAGDLELAADEMIDHLEYIKPKPVDTRSDLEKAADSLGGHLKALLPPQKNNQTERASSRQLPATS